MKEDDTIIGQGMVMTKNVGGMWEPIRDRRLERRVMMLVNQDVEAMLKMRKTYEDKLAKATALQIKRRSNFVTGVMHTSRSMIALYNKMLEAWGYRTGAA